MSEFELLREDALSVIREFVEKNPPPRPGGEMHVNYLLSMLESDSEVKLGEMLKHLLLAGYNAERIIYLFYQLKIVSSSDDVVRLRDAIARVSMELMRSER